MTSNLDKEGNAFEADWRARFDRFAARGGSEATISGWSEHGLARRLRAISLFLRDCPPEKGALVVDLGCGTGIYCDTLKEKGFRPVGADFSLGMLKRAQAVTDGVALCAADLNALPFRTGSFRGLINVGVLQHLSRVDRALAEMGRVLQAESPACIITLNRWSLHALAASILSLVRSWCRGRLVPGRHAVRRSPGALMAEARRAGMEVVDISGVYVFPRGFRWLESLLDRLDGLRVPGSRRPVFLFFANAFRLVLRRRSEDRR